MLSQRNNLRKLRKLFTLVDSTREPLFNDWWYASQKRRMLGEEPGKLLAWIATDTRNNEFRGLIISTHKTTTGAAYQGCLLPKHTETYDICEVVLNGPEGDLIDIRYDWNKVEVPSSLKEFEKR
jgi:hypothetical protein